MLLGYICYKIIIMDHFDFSSKVYSKCKSIEQKIKLLGKYLLRNIKLVIDNDEYSLEEIEFYYFSKDHPDKYTHKDNDQLTNKMWYFHKYKNGTYKSGTYKGLDMTFGNGVDHGGILIRTIKNFDDENMVIGPCNVVNYIIEKTENNTTEDLVSGMKNLEIFNKKNSFYLKEDNNYDEDLEVFCGPRVGLSLKYPEYLVKDYRFLKNPDKIPKYKNTVVSALYKKGITVKTICDSTGIKKAFIDKAISEFNEGKDMDEDEVKEIGINKINVIYGYYCNN